MRSYSAAELGAISPRDFADMLAAIDAGARFKVFPWGNHDPQGEDPGSLFFLVQPGETLLTQRLWYALIAAIAPLVPVRGGGVMHLVWFTALAIRGGQDVTDSVLVRARRLLHAAAEDRAARDFLADLERRPAP